MGREKDSVQKCELPHSFDRLPRENLHELESLCEDQ